VKAITSLKIAAWKDVKEGKELMIESEQIETKFTWVQWMYLS
jgi:hypothetical protein